MVSEKTDAIEEQDGGLFGRFEKEREELVASIDSFRGISSEVGGVPVLSSLDSVAKDLSENRFRLAVLGAFKRGKSTLVNALMGRRLLPMGVVPLTSIITMIRYGAEEGAEIHFIGGESRSVAIAELPSFITETGNPGNRKGVAEAEVIVDHPLLESGVMIIDTPGIGSSHLQNTMVTLDFLESVDAAVFVLAADPPIGQEELEFLRSVREYASRIFFVLNKVDYMDGPELEESLEFSREVLRSALADTNPKLYPISAKRALKARLENGPVSHSENGFAVLERDLDDFLWSGRAGAMLDAARARIGRLCSEIQWAIDIEISVLQESMERATEKHKWLRERKNEVRLTMDDAGSLVDASLDRIIKELEGKLLDHVREVEPGQRSRLGDFIDSLDRDMGPGDYVRAVEERTGELIEEAFQGFLMELEVELNRGIEGAVSRFEGVANEVLLDLDREISNLFNISLPGRAHFISPIDRSRFRFGKIEILNRDTIMPGEIVFALPGPLFRRRIRRRALEKLSEGLDGHSGRIRYDFSYRLRERGRRLKTEVRSSLDLSLEMIDSAISAAQAMMGAAKEARASRTEELRGLRDEVRSLMPESRKTSVFYER